MMLTPPMSAPSWARRSLLASVLVCALAGAPSVIAGASAAQLVPGESPKPSALATLQQCVTSVTQAERSATFAGEMSALPGVLPWLDPLPLAGSERTAVEDCGAAHASLRTDERNRNAASGGQRPSTGRLRAFARHPANGWVGCTARMK